MPDFVHLHCRSHYSFLDGGMSPKEIVEAAKSNGMSSVALTDTANMCGMVEFFNAAKEEGLKPIFGAEIWIGQAPSTDDDVLHPFYHLLLIVENDVGYKNICKLITLAHQQRFFTPLVQLQNVLDSSEGLFCLTSGRHGPIGRIEKDEDLVAVLKTLQSSFHDRMFIELMDWGIEAHEQLLQRAISMGQQLNIPTVATNNCRYRDPNSVALYTVMRSISTGVSYTTTDPDLGHQTDQAYVKSTEEMLEIFDEQSLYRTTEIADRCQFSPVLGGTYLPNSEPPAGTRESQWNWLLNWFPPPKAFGVQDTSPPNGELPEGWDIVDAYFAWYARTGLSVRLQEDRAAHLFGSHEEYWERLEMELEVIQGMKFPTYHLIVAEFTNWAKDNRIAVGPGRGSAAGSVVVWSMQITDINPLQFGLMFERYLNPKRISMPDIDMDFEQERREDVIGHVRDKYGEDCVAQILTIGTMKAKGALKDCARACSVHYLDADKWSKEIPEGPKVKLWPSIQESNKLKRLYQGDPVFRHTTNLAKAIEGRPRQTGVHAAGVIITSKPVSEFIPMHFENGSSMTGLEMTGAEKMGLVKFDFLGLKTLDIIEEACRSIRNRTGKDPEIIQPLFDDPGVYKLIGEGDTLGLFQVESHGMQNLVRRMKPDNMEELTAILALYRPGPLGSGMVDQYIDCKHGRREVEYPHELLKDTLKPTHGVIVYQEQVMQAAQALAGYDLAGADLLRRAMGKKKQEEMDKQRSLFVTGCASNGISEEDATRIFNLIDHFAGYGFNKSHSASYAAVTYMTAYLKAHFREDLMAAAMSLEQSNREKLVAYVYDTLHAGIKVKGPDINKSNQRFSVEEEDGTLVVRFGLEAIKGLGGATLESILAARSQKKFTSIEDIQERTSANKSTIESLVYSGALDEIEPDRFEAWWKVNRPKIKSKLKKKDDPSQLLLFGGGKTLGEIDQEHMEEQEAEAKPSRWTHSNQLEREQGSIGCWLSGHPLDQFLDVEQRSLTACVTNLEEKKKGETVTLIGVITKIHKIKTRQGTHMTFFTIADRTGMTEVVLRPYVWEKYKDITKKLECVEISGSMDRDGSEGRVVVSSMTTLNDKRSTMAKQLNLLLTAEELNHGLLRSLKVLLDEYIVGKKRKGCKIRIFVGLDEDTSLKITLPGDPTLDIEPELFQKIESLLHRPGALVIPNTAKPVDTISVPRYADHSVHTEESVVSL